MKRGTLELYIAVLKAIRRMGIHRTFLPITVVASQSRMNIGQFNRIVEDLERKGLIGEIQFAQEKKSRKILTEPGRILYQDIMSILERLDFEQKVEHIGE